MVRKISLLVLSYLMAISAFAQTRVLRGTVLDSKTLEPLPLANVYVNFTTIGTTCDDLGNFSLPLPDEDVEVVFSFVGHDDQKLKVSRSSTPAENLRVRLVPVELKEVVISENRDDQWESNLRKFQTLFLGEAHRTGCTIQNPWVLDFTSGNNGLLKAVASEPLEIENLFLGYKVSYTLQDFRVDNANYFISGNVRFREIETPDAQLVKRWNTNRVKIYQGSLMHLLRSIAADNDVGKDYELYEDRTYPASVVRAALHSENLKDQLRPIDENALARHNADGTTTIMLPRRTEVHYKHRNSPKPIYRDVANEVSVIEAIGEVRMGANGSLINPGAVILQGEMSKLRVADMLPNDFRIEKKIAAVETHRIIDSPEKIYVLTDKPFYFPSETIWYKVFLNHRSRQSADSLSKVVYIELVSADGKVLKQNIHPVERAWSHGDMKIPDVLPGNYWIRGYSRWSLNFGKDMLCERAIKIVPASSIPVTSVFADTREGISVEAQTDVAPMKLTIRTLDKMAFSNVAELTVSIVKGDVPSSRHTILSGFAIPEHATSTRQYFPEQGLRFVGQLTNAKGKPQEGNVMVVHSNLKEFFATQSDASGRFELSGMSFTGTSQFLFEGKDRKDKKLKVTIGTPASDARSPDLNDTLDFPLATAAPVSTSTVFASDTMEMTQLDEVIITAKKIDHGSRAGLGSPDFVLDADQVSSQNSATLENLIPGLQLVPILQEGRMVHLLKFSGSIMIDRKAEYYSTEVNLYVDGFPVIGPIGTKAQRFLHFRPKDVERIEVTKPRGGGGWTFGVAGNGMIAIYTRTDYRSGDPQKFDVKNFQSIELTGFTPTHQFSSSTSQNRKPGTTIYWNPKVITNESGEAEIMFDADEGPGEYTIVVEGVSGDGTPLRATKRIHNE